MENEYVHLVVDGVVSYNAYYHIQPAVVKEAKEGQYRVAQGLGLGLGFGPSTAADYLAV